MVIMQLVKLLMQVAMIRNLFFFFFNGIRFGCVYVDNTVCYNKSFLLLKTPLIISFIVLTFLLWKSRFCHSIKLCSEMFCLKYATYSQTRMLHSLIYCMSLLLEMTKTLDFPRLQKFFFFFLYKS